MFSHEEADKNHSSKVDLRLRRLHGWLPADVQWEVSVFAACVVGFPNSGYNCHINGSI